MSMKLSGSRRMIAIACAAVALAGLPAVAQSWPGPEAYANNNFNGRDALKITGELADVQTVNGETILWVNAKKVEKAGFGARPGTEAPGAGQSWRVEGPGVAKLKDPGSLERGAKVTISGDNSADASCKPSCRIRADKVSVK